MPSTVPQSEPTSRIAIVTGAAQGIGESIALRLADDGLDVAVADLPAKREQLKAVAGAIRAKGRRTVVLTGDVTVEADVAALVDSTVEALGGLDVMIANAGLFWQKPLLESTVEEWDKMFSVNLKGVMLCFKYGAKQMIKQGRGGRIVGAASIAAQQGFPNASTYSASKFAVRGMAQSFALEMLAHNITVNTYAPGLVPTPLTVDPDDDTNGGPCTTIMKKSGLPLNSRLATTQDVSELVSYVVRPQAKFITGQCFNISGGAVMN